MGKALKVIDRGYNAMKRQFAAAKGQNRVLVGVQSSAGQQAVLVATWNEYGTVNMPARSFMRSAIEEHRGELQEFARELLDNYIEKGGDLNVALGRLGEKTKQLIQAKINSNIPPPNAPSTIRQKGSSKTLIDTGAMLQSIQWKLKSGGHEAASHHGHGGHE